MSSSSRSRRHGEGGQWLEEWLTSTLESTLRWQHSEATGDALLPPPHVQQTRWADICQDFQDLRIPRALNLNIVSVIFGEDNEFLEKW